MVRDGSDSVLQVAPVTGERRLGAAERIAARGPLLPVRVLHLQLGGGEARLRPDVVVDANEGDADGDGDDRGRDERRSAQREREHDEAHREREDGGARMRP